jgi:hypothetical protein
MPPASSTVTRRLISIVLIALAPVALGTWKFGFLFLVQFVYSPFLWMSIVPVGLAAICVRKGFVPMRSGDKVYRDQQPRTFWLNVRFMLFAGALLYGINALVAWVVMSRPR